MNFTKMKHPKDHSIAYLDATANMLEYDNKWFLKKRYLKEIDDYYNPALATV